MRRSVASLVGKLWALAGTENAAAAAQAAGLAMRGGGFAHSVKKYIEDRLYLEAIFRRDRNVEDLAARPLDRVAPSVLG